MDIDKAENEFTRINTLCNNALERINNGVMMLIYFIIIEEDLVEKFKSRPWFEELYKKQEEFTVEDAINNLYEGAKILTQVIDEVVE